MTAKTKSSRSTPAFQSLYRSVTLDMSEMQMVSNSLLDEPFIYGSNASPSTASSMLKDLLQFALRHNPVIQAYNTMAEIMQGSTGLPLLPTDAEAGTFGQQQHSGPLHDMYKQAQENAVYLAVNERPVVTAFPADAIIGGIRETPPLLSHANHPCNIFFHTLTALSLTHDPPHRLNSDLPSPSQSAYHTSCDILQDLHVREAYSAHIASQLPAFSAKMQQCSFKVEDFTPAELTQAVGFLFENIMLSSAREVFRWKKCVQVRNGPRSYSC